ncbi:hypothetical protein Ancab_039581 [Ancistrocladus abbreviatus]
MAEASANSGSISEEDLLVLDYDEADEAFRDRSGRIDNNLSDVEAEVRAQVYTRRQVAGRPGFHCHILSSDILMQLQQPGQPSKAGKEPQLEIDLPSLINQQEGSLEETKLHVAAREGFVETILEILNRNEDLIASEDSKGDLPLHVAARAGRLNAVVTLALFMKQFVKPELSIGKANMEGNTALHLAIQNGHEMVAWFLIQKEPDTSFSLNKEGISPLYLAIEARFRDLARYILSKIASTNYLDQTSPKKSVVHAAIQARDSVILKTVLKKLRLLVNSFDEEGQTPLSYAAYIGYLDAVVFILDMFPDSAFTSNKDDSYPIHKASGRGHVKIVEQFLLRFPETIHLLNGHGQSILHVVAMNGNTTMVSYLLKKLRTKKLMDMKDRDGNTALHLATMNDHLDVVSCLVDAGKCHP